MERKETDSGVTAVQNPGDLLRAVQRHAGDMPELAAAYVTAWGELGHVVKDSTNPHLGNDYASLKGCLDVVKPVLRNNGLALMQAPGEMTGDILTLEGLLIHRSGQSIRVRTQLPVAPQLDKKTGEKRLTAQAAGSAITYARRYQLMAIAGMAPTDDDGEAASEAGTAAPAAVSGTPSMGMGTVDKVIATAMTLDDLNVVRDAVKASGDQALADKFMAKRKSLKENASE